MTTNLDDTKSSGAGPEMPDGPEAVSGATGGGRESGGAAEDFTCSVCGQRFASKEDLRDHSRTLHAATG